MATELNDIVALNRLIHGYKVSRMLGLAAELGIADRIAADQAASAASLAVACGVLADPLLRLCRALAGFGIFTVSADEMVGHSGQSLLLRTDSVPSLHHAARFFTAPADWTSWGGLDLAMQGSVPFEALFGTRRFDHMQTHPEAARLFDAVMANSPDGRLGAVATAYDFSSASLIVDVGGGNGALLRAILTQHPNLRGLVFDREDVVSAIPAEDRLGGRIQVQAGDFFERTLPEADLYLLSWILHDWPDTQCQRILSNIRAAMKPEARVLLIERVLERDPAHGNPLDYLGDMQMMVMHGGRERTFPEFQALLSTTAGFGTVRAFPTASSLWIIESAAA